MVIAPRTPRPAVVTARVVPALVALAAAVTLLATALSASGGPAHLATTVSYGLPLVGTPDVARRFERPAQVWSAGHRGVDLRSVAGAAVLVPADGVVTFAGSVAGRGVVTVAHPDGRRSSLEPVSPSVGVGTLVVRGQVVGTLEAAGSHCAPAVCVHWGVRSGTVYEDPLALLPGGGPVVLLSSGGAETARSGSRSARSGARPGCRSARLVQGQTRSASMSRVRRRTMAAVCICEIRDSVTPRTRPISARVMPS